jgi:hypothetical protein
MRAVCKTNVGSSTTLSCKLWFLFVRMKYKFVISGFRRDVDKIALVWDITRRGSSIPTFRDNLSGSIFNGQDVQEERLYVICTVHNHYIILICFIS